MQGTKNLTEGVISRQLFNLAMPIMGTSFIQMALGRPVGKRGRSRYRRRWYPYLDDELDLLLE